MNSPTDADIIEAIDRNRDHGFRMLVGKYSERLYWHIRRMVHSHADAQDISQEVFVRIFRSIDRLRQPETLRGWMYRIATNEVLRHIERRHEMFTSLDSALDVASDEYIDYTDLEAIQLKKAIDTLPPKQRITFNLRYYDELEYDEIAATLDTTVSTARANYHNAKERIIQYMNSLNS